MQSRYIIALDQGTTSSRAIIYDKHAVPLYSRNREFRQYYPNPGWVEHDADEIFVSQIGVLNEVLDITAQAQHTDANEIARQTAAIGITNQRETVVLWEKATGKPVYNAIVWQCRRSSQICEELEKQGVTELLRQKTGLLLDAYFSATKIKWLFDNVSGLRERAEKGEILAGTIDTWILWKLSGGACHCTDVTNASRTMLFNIHTLEWDNEILEMLHIPRSILPTVHDSSEIYGYTAKDVCGFEIPLASAIGDQQAALFGQGCFNAGDAKNTYGTGCFMLVNTGEKPVVSKHKLLTTIALGYKGKVQYALEGSVFMGGAIIKWLRDELELISAAHDCDILAETVPNANGAYLVPAFTGLGTPYWDMYARGTIIGLTRGVKKAHICRAALEGIAFQVKDVIDCMSRDCGKPVSSLKVDGGACVSNVMMQFQADLLNIDVVRPCNVETTALGAAFLAGLAVGFWQSTDELLACWKTDRVFAPKTTEIERNTCCAGWKKAVERARAWAEPETSVSAEKDGGSV